MCGHFINNQEFKVFWFRGILPISVNDFNFLPILANFINLMESLGGAYVKVYLKF
jgi:hypothetical protein